MKIRTMQHSSRFYKNRRISTLVRKRAIQYFLSGIKSEKQIHQQYGTDRILLWKWRRWYWQHFEQPHLSPYLSPSKTVQMRSKEKALRDRIKALEKEKKELEKALDWERIKSETFETMIRIAEDELELPIRKKPGAKQSGK